MENLFDFVDCKTRVYVRIIRKKRKKSEIMREIESDEKTELKEFIVLRVWRSMTDAPEIPLTTQHPRNTPKMYEHDILFRDKSINLIFPHN